MFSAKTHTRLHRDWASGPNHPATILVVGWATNPGEPLLLEALANHPGCERLIFVPLNGAGRENMKKFARDLERAGNMSWFDWLQTSARAGSVLGYDITSLLDRRGGPSLGSKRIEQRLIEHFKKTLPTRVATQDDQLMINLHGANMEMAYFVRRHPKMLHLSDPASAPMVDDKRMLPTIGRIVREESGIKVVPRCTYVQDLASVEAFMGEHGLERIVLKSPYSSGGHGIYRIARGADGHLWGEHPDRSFKPSKEYPRHFALTDDFFTGTGMLAMEWLEPERGDMRIVMLGRDVVGGYTRHAQNSWLCNVAQGGSVAPLDPRRDLAVRDRRKLNALGQYFAKLGLHHTAVDLLADTRGERFVSEINIGNTDDLVELEAHWGGRNASAGRLSYPDQIATKILQSYREHKAAGEKGLYL